MGGKTRVRTRKKQYDHADVHQGHTKADAVMNDLNESDDPKATTTVPSISGTKKESENGDDVSLTKIGSIASTPVTIITNKGTGIGDLVTDDSYKETGKGSSIPSNAVTNDPSQGTMKDGSLSTIAGNNSSPKAGLGTFVTNEKGMINASIQAGETKARNNMTMINKEEINRSSIQDGVTEAPNNETNIQDECREDAHRKKGYICDMSRSCVEERINSDGECPKGREKVTSEFNKQVCRKICPENWKEKEKHGEYTCGVH